MMNQALLILFLFFSTLCWGQNRINQDKELQDSICQFGKKFDKPERIKINFSEIKVNDEHKIKEIHRAIPDSLKNEENEKWWFYNYFFESQLTDYDPIGDSTFIPNQDNFIYKLKDTYFFDINGDSLLDFIHYPKYYLTIMRNDIDAYEMFLQTKSGYKWLSFRGYIVDIIFHQDGTLDNLTTYQGPCCNDNQGTFYYYKFDKIKNELNLTTTEQILTCQIKGE
jgi:hypothetical protein